VCVSDESDRLPGLFLLKSDGYHANGRQAHFLALDVRHKAQVDIVVVALVVAFATVGLREPDPSAFDAVDGSDVNAIRAYNFHMFLYASVVHSTLQAVVASVSKLWQVNA
jgi:hypothetical protein